jgi:hypothetical protein
VKRLARALHVFDLHTYVQFIPQFVAAFWLGHKLAFSLTLNLRDGD